MRTITCKNLFNGNRMPPEIVDLDRFNRHIDDIAATKQQMGKSVRLHFKSLRCVDLTRRIFLQMMDSEKRPGN